MLIQLKSYNQITSSGNYIIKPFIIKSYIPKHSLIVVSPINHPSSQLILENSIKLKSCKTNSQLVHPNELQESHPIKHSLIDNQNSVIPQITFVAKRATVTDEIECQMVIEIGKIRQLQYQHVPAD
ncbi:unnamed protein product [Paramecium primaurelia]|uniref:Uncharacterized protein n=1 Tax=Paramecium primaurelia TaxID=5886 RepID=A0A8S1NMD2_PARPR|nr:unnamed protein product [Paramecium primaurelia]